MNNGITADEACRTGSLKPEDFSRVCNDDGSLKSQTQTTTFTIKNDSSKSFTVNNTVLLFSVTVFLMLVVLLTVVIFKKGRSK